MDNNFTQLAGVLALVPAALTSALASAATSRGGAGERLCWAIIAITHGLLAIEIVAMNRSRVDQLIVGWLKLTGAYPERRPVQALVVFVTLALVAVALHYIRRLKLPGALLVSASSTAFLLAVFVVESVSLHAVDAIFYRYVGPIMLIGWLWLACGVVTIAGSAQALLRIRRVQRRVKPQADAGKY